MLESSARLLALLGHLQSRERWTGAELSARLGVSDRTVRKDVQRLRTLGYPVDSVRGPDGFYTLGRSGRLPPLLLDDDEAVAIAAALAAATGLRDRDATAARALTKLEHVLPDRLRRRVTAMRDALSAAPDNTSTTEPDPEVDSDVLASIALAIRDRVEVRCRDADGARRDLQPYRLVAWQRRWYLVARDAEDDAWHSHRVDRLTLGTPATGRRFTPRPLDGGDYPGFVLREVASTGWAVHVRIIVDAPADAVVDRINPAVGAVEPLDADHCVLVSGADDLETVAVYIGLLGMDFHVEEPPELVAHIAALADRYRRALPPT